MTHHEDKPEILIENNPPQGISIGGGAGSAILLGCIIIAASILYSGNMITKKLVGGSAAQVQNIVAGQQVGAQQQQAAPAQPGVAVAVTERADAPMLGSKNAKVTLVEFSDFQCPFCKRFVDETFSQIKQKYVDTGKVKIVFRHYPLAFHANAQKAGEAAECANRQGKFWEYHDVLFSQGKADGTGLDIASLKKYADDLGLNKGTLGFKKDQFNQCLDSGATAEIVKNDMAVGSASGVSGTPTIFINGKTIVGAQPLASFEQAIEAALK